MSQYTLPADGTSNSSGAITITFPQVAVNTIASGTVSVPAAPQGAVWNVLVNGESQGQMVGSTPFGTIQIENSDTLSLTATGVLPSTQYQAVFIGAIDYGTVPSAIPTPQATAILSSSAPDVLYSSTVNLPSSGTVTIQNIAMPAPYQSIMVVLANTGNTSFIDAVNQTNGGFFGDNGPIGGSTPGTDSTAFGSTYAFPMVNEPGDNLELKIISQGVALSAVPIIVFGVRSPLVVLVEPTSSSGLPVSTTFGQNIDVLPLGGHYSSTGVQASTTETEILGDLTGTGSQYRIHSLCAVNGAATQHLFLIDSTNQPFASVLSGQVATLGGRLVNGPVYVNSDQAGGIGYEVGWDQVFVQSIG